MKIDKNIIKELTDYLNEFNLTEIEYTDKDTKIKVSKSTLPSSNQFVNSSSNPSSGNVTAKDLSKVITGTTKEKDLGNTYTGEQTLWQFDFNIEAEDSLTVDMLNTDFNLIPIITDLAETAEFKNQVFSTQNNKICNINFVLLDK